MICASVPEAAITPRRQPLGIAVAHHHRQRDQAHREHRGGDDAGRRREQRADEHHRVGDAAADRAEQLADGVEQVLGHAAALEDQAHEREERDREQRGIAHDAEHALGQRLQQRGLQQAHARCRSRRRTGRSRRARTRPDSRAAGTPPGPPNISGAISSSDIRRAPSSRCRRDRGCRPFEERDALDDFGNALQREQREGDRDQQAHRPADQPAADRRSARRCARS